MHLKPLIYCLLAAMLFTCCDAGFDEINTDPNVVNDVDAVYLLSTAITKTAYSYQDEAYYRHPASAGRYVTLVRNENMDKFSWGPRDWTPVYTRLMTIKQLQTQAEKHHQPQYVVLSRILRAFNFAYITDLWGDAPYSKALLAREKDNIHPAYDKQETIYIDLLYELKACNEALRQPLPAIDAEYDVLFKGDVEKWRRFANSLRLRMLLRCAKNYPNAWAEMQLMVNDPQLYPLVNDQAYNAVLRYIGTNAENSWPGSDVANGYNEFDKRKPSKELVDMLLTYNDPRIRIWIDKVVDVASATIDKNEYVGVPNAISQPAQYNGGNNCISNFAPAMNKAADPRFNAILIGCWEVSFILSEALQSGRITMAGCTGQSMYYQGIKQSMEYYGAGVPYTSYTAQPLVKYNGSLRQLMHQKWLSQLNVGAEGWLEHRRTGFPVFVPGPLAAQRNIPLRYMYPLTEILNNPVEYDRAKKQMGGDEQTTRMWLIK
ncbi:SusD/RagB family nutrient-binding outer membrane lipoprotein [Chitinophaga horti]|uniref:SusD/RagB family nutrient-binding outer membrane lipoprotein n=1 Tax=Chitinophaga horti TaxID=2920382 RepID=A0ABY6IWZ7_9BACT|nr:SusD/RagB family nutrient-binding outer membrane lipoprotein [Chitinophaga horti]UYQ91896.1 SusD/RagB family nutrient-binding outer membrane lipoprotein [Chitinophaga horti]